MSDYPSNWNRIRKKVYERDNYTCQNCGATDVELHAHHIVPKSKGGTDQLSNLKTMCSDCHDAIHNSSIAPTHPKHSSYTQQQKGESKHFDKNDFDNIEIIGHYLNEQFNLSVIKTRNLFISAILVEILNSSAQEILSILREENDVPDKLEKRYLLTKKALESILNQNNEDSVDTIEKLNNYISDEYKKIITFFLQKDVADKNIQYSSLRNLENLVHDLENLDFKSKPSGFDKFISTTQNYFDSTEKIVGFWDSVFTIEDSVIRSFKFSSREKWLVEDIMEDHYKAQNSLSSISKDVSENILTSKEFRPENYLESVIDQEYNFPVYSAVKILLFPFIFGVFAFSSSILHGVFKWMGFRDTTIVFVVLTLILFISIAMRNKDKKRLIDNRKNSILLLIGLLISLYGVIGVSDILDYSNVPNIEVAIVIGTIGWTTIIWVVYKTKLKEISKNLKTELYLNEKNN